MLKRKAYKKLVSWKKNKTAQGLLIDGARQVGKTTLIREFARDHYKHVAEIDFYENKTAAKTIDAAVDTRDLLLRISALSRSELVPGETVIFLDEVQESSDILTWLKFLAEGSDYDFVLSGSMLGLDSFPARSLPVGYLNRITMFPLDFEEYCWAIGIPPLVLGEIRDCVLECRVVPPYLHEIMTDAFYKYLLVGGFPDAVQSFVTSDGLAQVRNVHAGIHDLYLYDISKYVEDKTEARQIRMVYESLPGQLNHPNKRFKYTRLGKNLRFADLETAFDWLGHAGVALIASKVSEPAFPLGLSEDASSLKLYANDVGLLTSRLMPGVDVEILNRKSSINFGSIFENAAAQELFSQQLPLHYYNSTRNGEIDFVTQTELGDVALCEIKSGKDYRRHSALNNLLASKNYHIARSMVFCEGERERKGSVDYLPIYSLGLLKDILEGSRTSKD